MTESAFHELLDKQALHDLVMRWCRAIDRFERRAGEWRIAHRRVVLESASPGYDMAAFTPGFRDRRDPSYEREPERD